MNPDKLFFFTVFQKINIDREKHAVGSTLFIEQCTGFNTFGLYILIGVSAWKIWSDTFRGCSSGSIGVDLLEEVCICGRRL